MSRLPTLLFCMSKQAMTAPTVEQMVANNVVMIIRVGSLPPESVSAAMAVVGNSCTLELVMTRKRHIALLAEAGSVLSFCKACMARMLMGMLALLNPSIELTILNVMAPMAG